MRQRTARGKWKGPEQGEKIAKLTGQQTETGHRERKGGLREEDQENKESMCLKWQGYIEKQTNKQNKIKQKQKPKR